MVIVATMIVLLMIVMSFFYCAATCVIGAVWLPNSISFCNNVNSNIGRREHASDAAAG